ncbi:GDP-mannose 4,6-dehydratase [Rubrivirga sp.]|uniref:GDP-mannose 4,6-dehydratase n=1 Tax=Rubrivirga sp. TaxID=1885344 RepID=UPI003C779D91
MSEHPPKCLKRALVTGGAGFIGSHVVDRLLRDGWEVTAIDNFDPFYSPATKRTNTADHLAHPAYTLLEADIRDADVLRRGVTGEYDVVVHLAAKAGVRPSIETPEAYQTVNVQGTQTMLELAREREIPQFVFASSSSVYGVSPDVPWKEDAAVTRPISPYAATKVAGELLGHVYAHLYAMRFVALRFFTVYGPRQRPDLAINKFASKMLRSEPIPLFGDGSTLRDYTHVFDIVEGVMSAIAYRDSDYEVINLGNNRTVRLSELVDALQDVMGVDAEIDRHPAQPGDVPQTWADVSKAQRLLGYEPRVTLREGLASYVAWRATQGDEPGLQGGTALEARIPRLGTHGTWVSP